jgi:thioredoxin-like negative regulator of GroEL
VATVLRDMTSSPKKFPWLLVLLFIVVLGVVAVFGVKKWRVYVIKSQDNRFYTQAQALLAQHRDLESLAVIDQRNRAVKTQTPALRDKWLDLEIEALGQADQVARLVDMYLNTPAEFYQNEKRGLVMGRAILHRQDMEAFEKFRTGWKNHESNQPAWFILDADYLLLDGKREAAIKFLNSRSFPGAQDSDRLMRLALLDVPGDVPAASAFLDRAAAADPRNPDVRLFRGQLFESYGHLGEARLEYAAAFEVDTNNTAMRERFGDFYRRHSSYDQAIQTWLDGITSAATSDEIWVKALFWSRVARNVPFNWKSATPPNGDLQPLVEYLLKLPPGKFWDDPTFERMPQARRYTSDQQSVFWLKLISQLQAKNYDEASRMLEFNKFRPQSWNVDLESVLLRVLVYRKTGELKFPVGVNLPIDTHPPATRHEFLNKLDSYTRSSKEKVPADLDRILRDDTIFSLIFLLNGWSEAALQMPPPQVVPDYFPDWVAEGFAHAYYHEHGADAALAFIARQKPTPLLGVFEGGILVDNGKADAGIARLSSLAKLDSDEGMQAASDLTKALINRKDYDGARATIASQPRLQNSVSGKELLAGINLLQDRKADAEQIYRSILEDSDDAKIYFAKVAFNNKDWATARKLTEELVNKYPDRLQYRANLEAINKAEQGK